MNDYQAKKELLVFVYYLLEFDNSSLFTEVVSHISTLQGQLLPLLKVVEDVVCVYQ